MIFKRDFSTYPKILENFHGIPENPHGIPRNSRGTNFFNTGLRIYKEKCDHSHQNNNTIVKKLFFLATSVRYLTCINILHFSKDQKIYLGEIN